MGGIEESPTVAAVQDGHFAEPPRHDRILTRPLLPGLTARPVRGHERRRWLETR